MNHRLVATTLTLGLLGSLAVACSAQVGDADGNVKGEGAAQTSEALSSCVAFLPAAETTAYSKSTILCDNFFEHPPVTSAGTYGTSSCEYFATEYTGTAGTNNTSGSWLVTVNAGSLTQAQCAASTIDFSVYGFEDSITGPGGWQSITSASTVGTWNGTSCQFNAGTVEQAAFNDKVPNPPPGMLSRYQDIIVYAQAYETMTYIWNGLQRVTTYFPVSVSLGEGNCTILHD